MTENTLQITKPIESLTRDLESEVPDLVPYLLFGEEIVNIEYPEIVPSNESQSAIKALFKLTGADRREQVGANGPVRAATSTENNAGIEDLQLFNVVFGRDSLRVSLDLLDHYPKLMRATIIELAELQGIRHNPRNGEEPGRIIHENRDIQTDKIAQKLSAEQGWEWPYYESIDSTVLFITAIKRYCKQEGYALLSEQIVGKDGRPRNILGYFNNSVSWLINRLRSSPRGLLEFQRRMGIDPETWKDSPDSFSHANGEIANLFNDIASLEVQVLAYDALLDAAALYEKGLALPQLSTELRSYADNIKQKIFGLFWVDDPDYFGGYFAQGLDYDQTGRTRQLRVRTSDMGHLLNSRLLDGDVPDVVAKRESIIRNLFSPDMLNASGIRTLARNEKRFKPGGYHTGSVWLWDTYYIAQGLERHGYYGLSELLKERIWKVSDTNNIFPEFARGDNGLEQKLNQRIIDVFDKNALTKHWNGQMMVVERGQRRRIEQPPQEIQAWSVAAILSSKIKRNPNNPQHAIPNIAIDPIKRRFEEEIINSVRHYEDSLRIAA